MNETINIGNIMDASKFDWGSYYERGINSLKQELESKPEMWDRWTNSDKRYFLVSKFYITEDNFDENLSGRVTNHFDAKIGADSPESLEKLFKSKYFQSRFDSTTQHFIFDNQEKKIINFLSVCM